MPNQQIVRKIAILVFIFTTSICSAKYEPQILSRLIDNATLIGRGEIIKIEGSQILIRLDELYKGKTNTKILKVNKFKDWTCAWRWTPYKIGQKELLFLKNSSFESYDILGSGNEGEMPIFLNILYYKSPDNNFDDNATEYEFNGDSLWGYKMNLSDINMASLAMFCIWKRSITSRKIKNLNLKKLIIAS